MVCSCNKHREDGVSRKQRLLLAAITLLFVLLSTLTLLPSSAVANPYTGGNANCTYVAWQKAYDLVGVSLPNFGNARDWYSRASSAGYSVGTAPQAKSIAVWSASQANPNGHVAYVKEVSGSQMYILEGGYLGGYHEGWVPTSGPAYPSFDSGSKLIGFIYLSGPKEPDKYIWLSSDGWYEISPKCAPDKKLDIANASSQKGANLQLQTANDSSAQNFYIQGTGKGNYRIKPKCSNLLLDIEDNSKANGANVFQWSETGAGGQYWVFLDAGDGYVYIRSSTGRYLDVQNGGTSIQTNICAMSFNGSSAQKWKLIPVSGKTKTSALADGTYFLQSATGSRVLDVSWGSIANDANIQIHSWNNTVAQVFNIKRLTSGVPFGSYTIRQKASNRSLDTYKNTNGIANVIQYDYNGNYGQTWYFEDAGGGYYYIRNAWGFYLDLLDGKDVNSQNVRVFTYNASKAQKWKPVLLTVANASMSGINNSVTYTGSSIIQNPSVVFNGISLKAGTDYDVSHSYNLNVGIATVTITGKGSYTGTKSVIFSIAPASITNATISGMDSSHAYTGSAIKPRITVTWNGKTLVEGTDYTLSYSNNVNVGTATVTITGKGNFTGTKSTTFKIIKNDSSSGTVLTTKISISKATVASIANQVYTGSVLSPRPKVVYNNKTLVEGTDYTLSYKNNTNIGTATITIAGKGNYTGTKTVNFTIVEGKWKRLFGANQMRTMQAIVQEGWRTTGGTVVIANMWGYRDALSVSGVAGLEGAPIILTSGTSLSPQTKEELVRLKPSKVIVAGGTSAITEAVFNDIKRVSGAKTVMRLWGATAPKTAVALNNTYVGKWDSDGIAFLAHSNGWRDSASAASIAYAKHYPVYLAETDGSVSANTIASMKKCGIKEIIILGGTLVIPEKTVKELSKQGFNTKTRLGGKTAIDTSQKVAEWGISKGMKANNMAVIGFGTSRFREAFSGAALCGKNGSLMVMSYPKEVANTEIPTRYKASIKLGYIFGDTVAIYPEVHDAFEAATS